MVFVASFVVMTLNAQVNVQNVQMVDVITMVTLEIA